MSFLCSLVAALLLVFVLTTFQSQAFRNTVPITKVIFLQSYKLLYTQWCGAEHDIALNPQGSPKSGQIGLAQNRPNGRRAGTLIPT